MADYLKMDASGLTEMSKLVRKAAERIEPEIAKTTIIVAEDLAGIARTIASSHSSTIAPTIHALAGPRGTAIVRAGGPDSPIAGLYEKGNKGRGGSRGKTFRHPVFGNKSVWVAQDRYPFLAPARRANRVNMNRKMAKAWDEALRVTGMKTRWEDLNL